MQLTPIQQARLRATYRYILSLAQQRQQQRAAGRESLDSDTRPAATISTSPAYEQETEEMS